MEHYNYFIINFVSSIAITFLLIFLHAAPAFHKKIKKLFMALVYLQLAQLIFYTLELWTATFEHPTIARTLSSALRDSIYIVIVYLIFLLSFRNRRTNRKISVLFVVPMVINIILSFSAFFTDIVYTYTENNEFTRGPLGYAPYFILVLYLFLIFITSVTDMHLRSRLETVIILSILGLICFSVFMEMKYHIRNVSQPSIVLGITFYYMFFQTQLHVETVENHKQKYELFKEKARVDGLTGLLNKMTFQERIMEELSDGLVNNIALVVVDLDYFKEVNDKLGHLVGDKAIKDVARKIKNIFRSEDHISRFGGDEFCVFLKNIPMEVLELRLGQILSAVAAEYSNEQNTVRISASIGAVFCEAGETFDWEKLFQLADDAAYYCKGHGRNQYQIVTM